MQIVVAGDHRGWRLRAAVVQRLRQLGHEVEDLGTYDEQPVDYPDLAAQVARKVSSGQADGGVLLSGSGLGMAVTANKFPGVRAAPCHDDFTVAWGRRHLDINVLCLPADLVSQHLAVHLVETWVSTPFDGGRHARRIGKIAALEKQLGVANDQHSDRQPAER